MLSAYRRLGVVAALALLAGVASIVGQAPDRSVPLPPVAGLTYATGWHVVSTYTPSWQVAYRQWLLSDPHGAQALLYVSVSSGMKMMHWSGELGYEGEGYQVLHHAQQRIRLYDGTVAPISSVVVQHLADRRLVEYAVVGADGIAAHPTDDLLHTVWNVVTGGDRMYYLVRVSVPQKPGDRGADALATRLLSPVLSTLHTLARANAL